MNDTNTPPENFEQTLKTKCDNNRLYQLEIKELSLLTSMTACYYLNSSGLNDTISFQTDSGSKHIIGMQIETKDIAHLVSIEKSAKKKRLLKTRQFTVHAGSAVLSKMIEGSSPQLEKENYDAQGNER